MKEFKEWFLSMDKDVKLGLLESALKDDKFSEFMQLSKIVLDAPITDGGISTEEIENVRTKYF